MAMIIDAMELLYTDQPHAFAIVSSDADFTPLVMHLKSKGAAVFGFGQKKSPEPFQRACSTFLFVESLVGESAQLKSSEVTQTIASETDTLQPIPSAKLRMDTRLVKLLRGAVQSAANEEGWAMLGIVGNHISNQASFDPRNYGYDRLGEIFEATQLFETKRVTTVMYVRDIRFGKTKAAPLSTNA